MRGVRAPEGAARRLVGGQASLQVGIPHQGRLLLEGLTEELIRALRVVLIGSHRDLDAIEAAEERDDLLYQNNESEPYSGWVKSMRDSGQVRALAQFKDGELDGVNTWWHENGQKKREASYEDGEEVSAKYWNSKGEEVETAEKAAE